MSNATNLAVEAYEKFAAKTKEFWNESKDKSSQALEDAMEKAKSAQEKSGEITRQQGAQFKRFLQRDVEQTAHDLKQAGQKASESLRPTALQSSVSMLVSSISDQASGLIDKLSTMAEKEVTLKTGEVTGPAKMICTQCEQSLHFESSGHVPPCPNCHSTEFKRAA